MSWAPLKTPLFPWGRTLDKIVASAAPPSLRGQTIVVASDYGGIDRKSRYRVDAFLCMDLESSLQWEAERRAVRKQFLADGRRMSYKRLTDPKRVAALIPFLTSALSINGLLFVTIVNRNLRHLCFGHEHQDGFKKAADLKARWKPGELDTAIRIAHVVGCLVGGMSSPNQNCYWISDEDNLFGNERQSKDVASLLSRFSSYYASHPMGELGIGTTKLDEGDRWEEDMTAIADLVAGGLAETTNRLSEYCGGRLPNNLAIEYQNHFPPKAELIANWFWKASGRLARVAMVFERADTGYAAFKHEMAP
jgi:hypothetical protein